MSATAPSNTPDGVQALCMYTHVMHSRWYYRIASKIRPNSMLSMDLASASPKDNRLERDGSAPIQASASEAFMATQLNTSESNKTHSTLVLTPEHHTSKVILTVHHQVVVEGSSTLKRRMPLRKLWHITSLWENMKETMSE